MVDSFLFFEERDRSKLHFLDRLKVLQDALRVLAADLRVKVEGEAVRAFRIDQLRLEREKGFHRVERYTLLYLLGFLT